MDSATQANADPDRIKYVGGVPEGRAHVVMQAFLELFSDAEYVEIDAYPAPSWGDTFASLPPAVRDAHAHIAGLRPQPKDGRENLMAVRVDIAVPENRAAVAAFGPYSIQVTFIGDVCLASMDDSGYSCYANFTEEQYESFLRLVPDAAEWLRRYVPQPYGCLASTAGRVAATLLAAAGLGWAWLASNGVSRALGVLVFLTPVFVLIRRHARALAIRRAARLKAGAVAPTEP
jgi:hypothetical protein